MRVFDPENQNSIGSDRIAPKSPVQREVSSPKLFREFFHGGAHA